MMSTEEKEWYLNRVNNAIAKDKMKTKLLDGSGRSFIYTKIKKSKYKYMMTYPYQIKLNFKPLFSTHSSHYSLSADGIMNVRPGYCWDGASGPTIDTKNTMIASCVHDVLYQMIRCCQLGLDYKDKADLELERIMVLNSTATTKFGHFWSNLRSSYYYYGVKFFGKWSCVPGSQ